MLCIAMWPKNEARARTVVPDLGFPLSALAAKELNNIKNTV